jgi:hypothetical protein
MPSQLMENWRNEKDFLDRFARHYETDQLIPEEWITRLKKAENFNVGYSCLRQLSFGFLDMAWYSLREPFVGDVMTFEQEAWRKAQILPTVDDACMSTQFNHIFSGGYAAGYYSYKWSEALDADIFSVFKTNGLYDRTTAQSFRDKILSKGNSGDPMLLYVNFRGKEPSIDALLERDGVTKWQTDKYIAQYENIIDRYLSLIESVKTEYNPSKRKERMDDLIASSAKIQEVTVIISNLSEKLTDDQRLVLEKISLKLEKAGK